MGNFTRQVNVTEIKEGYVEYKRLNPEVISFGCFLQSSLMTHCKLCFVKALERHNMASTQFSLCPSPPQGLS